MPLQNQSPPYRVLRFDFAGGEIRQFKDFGIGYAIYFVGPNLLTNNIRVRLGQQGEGIEILASTRFIRPGEPFDFIELDGTEFVGGVNDQSIVVGTCPNFEMHGT